MGLMKVPRLVLRTWCRYAVDQHRARMSTQQGKRPESVMNVFDRNTKRMQRDRITVLPDYQVYDYIKEEVGFRTADRICDINRKFNKVVELGCGRGYVSRHVLKDNAESIYQTELSQRLLMQSEVSPEVPTYRIVADEEFIPFKDNSIDLVVSSLSLHWVNNLPGCFKQVFNCLKNDGVFLGCMFGGQTLFELRVSLQLAELEREGGFAAHVSPFTDVQDLGNLLTRSGYTMLTIDVDEIQIVYPSMYELMYDLKDSIRVSNSLYPEEMPIFSISSGYKLFAYGTTVLPLAVNEYTLTKGGMGESNCAWSRKSILHRDTAKAAAAIYQEMYGVENGVPATYQVINFIGWKPDPSQPKAAQRGSGEVSLKDLGRLDELARDINKMRESQDKPDDPNKN